MNIIRVIVFVIFLLPIKSFAQGYDEERIALGNFIVRLYENNPFEGVRIVADYNNDYLLSAVLVKNNGNETASNRIAQVKNNRQVSVFINGLVTIDSKTIILTKKDVQQKKSNEEIIEILHESSVGMVRGMEILRVIDRPDNYRCYLFYRKIEEMK